MPATLASLAVTIISIVAKAFLPETWINAGIRIFSSGSEDDENQDDNDAVLLFHPIIMEWSGSSLSDGDRHFAFLSPIAMSKIGTFRFPDSVARFGSAMKVQFLTAAIDGVQPIHISKAQIRLVRRFSETIQTFASASVQDRKAFAKTASGNFLLFLRPVILQKTHCFAV